MVKYKLKGSEVLKDGHTMFQKDIVKDLNRKAYLEDLREKEAGSSVPFSGGLEGPMEERTGWISVDDRLPELYEQYDHSDKVLVTDGRDIRMDCYYREWGWYEKMMWQMKEPITHWIPLPELPKAD